MSDITLVQLIDLKERREQRAQQKLGIRDCLTLPLACVLPVCVILSMSVAGIVAVIFGLFRQPDTQR